MNMRFFLLRVVVLWAALVLPVAAAAGSSASLKPAQVVLETSLGDIVVQVYHDRAPRTAAYFLGLVDRGDYDGASFYRAGVPLGADADGPELIQGGVMYGFVAGPGPASVADLGLRLLERIETTEETGLKHRFATVSFARDLWESGQVIPEIFICLGDLPSMDFDGRSKPDNQGFPAFATVIEGMDTVRKIADLETGGTTRFEAVSDQILAEPVLILKAYRR